MLEIPACNAGAYREYLVCHETLQDRPCLRLPVCGETAVPCSLLSAFLYPHPLPPSCFLSMLFPILATIFCKHRAVSFSFFEMPFINYYKSRVPENKNAEKSYCQNAEIFARVCIYLQCCCLSRCLSCPETFTLYSAQKYQRNL